MGSAWQLTVALLGSDLHVGADSRDFLFSFSQIARPHADAEPRPTPRPTVHRPPSASSSGALLIHDMCVSVGGQGV